MIAVIQRVDGAKCTVDSEITGQSKMGLCILLGVSKEDTEEDAKLLCEKISKLRIFCDEDYKMNLSVMDVNGEVMVISNFTLLANYSHGNRPEYFNAMPPKEADRLYEYFVSLMKTKVSHVATGRFGAEMHIDLSLAGPVTIVMDSDRLKKKR